jgi:sulfate adenylyltransferase subunit 1
VKADFAAFAAAADPDGAGPIAGRARIEYFPISALEGDNVVARSQRTPFYTGPAMLELLDALPGREALEHEIVRLHVQYVIRPQSPAGAAHHDYRGYAGQLATGTLRVGDEIVALPQDRRSRVTRIHVGPRDVAFARAPESIAIELADDVDISRGSLLAHPPPANPSPETARSTIRVTRDLEATIIWMHASPLLPNQRYLVKHGGTLVAAQVRAIASLLDVHTLASRPDPGRLGLNEIGRAALRLASPIACEPYRVCRATGAFILINEHTNDTAGAGLIL